MSSNSGGSVPNPSKSRSFCDRREFPWRHCASEVGHLKGLTCRPILFKLDLNQNLLDHASPTAQCQRIPALFRDNEDEGYKIKKKKSQAMTGQRL